MVALDLDAPVRVSQSGTSVLDRTRAAVHGRSREALVQLVVITVLYLTYRIGRLLAADEQTHALANARTLLTWEDRLQMPNEQTLQSIFAGHDFLAVPANLYYATAHFAVAICALLWLWTFRPMYYRVTRNLMVALTAAALALHMLIPLAPPRMLPEYGFVDLAAEYGQSVYGPPDTDTLSNQYAAMPSLHVGWALLLAMGLIAATRTPWRWLLLLHPLITTLVVVATGNHYWFDALTAIALLAVATLLHPPVLNHRATDNGRMLPPRSLSEMRGSASTI
ncbi:inositol phosphorylceramide synthase [Nocardia sp. SYP-A9097]|uniref:phosphatase PAP2 family protein n=1 Tax=Nocardia sp. SYP-A9097 TaxID=2663237 RepID=UPI00129B0AE7|nr:phosphatase PAP2 family protein [Nocardia sp. SYP-A9097]MRH90787.1 inositol phosphorylceramide synthase [Nocardia sp. SYP-A9097]